VAGGGREDEVDDEGRSARAGRPGPARATRPRVDARARGPDDVARAAPSAPGPLAGQDVGQDASMASSTAWSDLSLAIHSVISDQNEPAPTAAGIMSEPSKRNV
jgi:hypothetical protein